MRARGARRLQAVIVFAVVCAAAAMRLLPVSLGLPYEYHCDEPEVVQQAFRMMKSGDFNPHSFVYPSLYKYIQLAVAVAHYYYALSHGIMTSLSDLVTSDEAHCYHYISIPSFYPWARGVAALFGAATVFVLYLIGREAFGGWAGILSALFLCVTAPHVHESTYVRVEVPMTFFACLCILQCYRYIDRPRWRHGIAAGAFAGLAAATKYNGGALAALILPAWLLARGDGRRSVLRVSVFLCCAAVMFLIACPYALLDFRTFLDDSGAMAYHYGAEGHEGWEGTPGVPQLAWYIKRFYRTSLGRVYFILAAAGFVAALVRAPRKTTCSAVFVAAYMGWMCSQRVHNERNVMIVMSFAALWAGVSLSVLLEGIGRFLRPHSLVAAAIIAAILLAVFLPPAASVLSESWNLSRLVDSRTQMLEWMKSNLPPHARVAFSKELHFHEPTLTRMGFDYLIVPHAAVSAGALWSGGVDYAVTSDKFTYHYKKDGVRADRSSRLRRIAALREYNSWLTELPAVKTFGHRAVTCDMGAFRDPLVRLRKVTADALPPRAVGRSLLLPASLLRVEGRALRGESELMLPSNASVITPPLRFPRGSYRVSVVCRGTPAKGVYPVMRASLRNGAPRLIGERHSKRRFRVLSFPRFRCARETVGQLAIEFTNDAVTVQRGRPTEDRNIWLREIRVRKAFLAWWPF